MTDTHSMCDGCGKNTCRIRLGLCDLCFDTRMESERAAASDAVVRPKHISIGRSLCIDCLERAAAIGGLCDRCRKRRVAAAKRVAGGVV